MATATVRRHRPAAALVAVLAVIAAVERVVGSATRTTDDGIFVTQYDRANLELILLQAVAAATVAGLAGREAATGDRSWARRIVAGIAALVYAAIWLVPGLMDQVLGPS